MPPHAIVGPVRALPTKPGDVCYARDGEAFPLRASISTDAADYRVRFDAVEAVVKADPAGLRAGSGRRSGVLD